MSGFEKWAAAMAKARGLEGEESFYFTQSNFRAAYEAGRKEMETQLEWEVSLKLALLESQERLGAQVAMLHDALQSQPACSCDPGNDCYGECSDIAAEAREEALSATAPTVEAFLSRVREEAKREEREACRVAVLNALMATKDRSGSLDTWEGGMLHARWVALDAIRSLTNTPPASEER